MNSIRVAILDGHPLFTIGMVTYLKREVGCDVVYSESCPFRFLDHLKSGSVDLLIFDFLELSKCGIDVGAVRRRYRDLRLIATSSSSFELARIASLSAGADGFYGKNEGAEKLVRVVLRVVNGIRDKINAAGGMLGGSQFHALSRCELEVILACLEGSSVAEIARRKGRSIKTVSRQKRLAYQKLGIKTDFELFRDEHVLRSSNLLPVREIGDLSRSKKFVENNDAYVNLTN